MLLVLLQSGPAAAKESAPSALRPGTAVPPPLPPAERLPLELFFADPDFSDPRLSPDGSRLAVLRGGPGGTRNLVVIDLGTYEQRVLTAYDDHAVSWFVWVDETRIAFRAEPTTPGWLSNSELFNIVRFGGASVRTSRFSARPPGLPTRFQIDYYGRWHSLRVLDRLPDDDRHILVTMRNKRLNRRLDVSGVRPGDHVFTDVATLNLRNGARRRVVENPGNVYHWLVDHDGEVRLAVALDEDLRVHLMHREADSDAWVSRHSFAYDEAGIWPLAFSPDPDIVYVLSNVGRDTKALYTYDMRTAALGERLFAHNSVDVGGIVLSHHDRRAIGVRYETDRQQVHYFDSIRQAVDTALHQALADYEIDVRFGGGNSAVVLAYNDRNPGRVYHFDGDQGRLKELFRSQGELPEELLARTRPIAFAARDGLPLNGFLTMPQGGTPAPMVVVVHGGPHESRDSWGYDPEVQFLANRGYAVLQVNFRGSGGYGRDFEQLGWGHWAGAIQDDIADAVRWAVDAGYGDPGRVCIYGSSFGGYSALMSLALNPDLYRCGASFGAVTDLPALAAEGSGERSAFLDMVVGTGADRNDLEASSPLHRVGEIRAPVLVAHGVHDSVVPVTHFRKLVEALVEHEKPGRGLLLEAEGHDLADRRTRLAFYRALEAFLAEHLRTLAPVGAMDLAPVGAGG